MTVELPIHLKALALTKRRHTGNVPYETMLKVIGHYDDATLRVFSAFEGGYNHFKAQSFGNCLSPVILILNRKPQCMGHYRPYACKNIPTEDCGESVMATPDRESAKEFERKRKVAFSCPRGP